MGAVEPTSSVTTAGDLSTRTQIHDLVVSLADGKRTVSEELGHQEFILTYKTFEPIGPACMPAN